MPLLDVKNLSVDLRLKDGPARVVDALSFSLDARETLGLVGESGCGKSMTSLALMRLIPPNVGELARGSSVVFDGRELTSLPRSEMRKLRGADMSLILQDSMTVLNPVTTIKKQMTETLRAHMRVSRREAVRISVDMLGKMGIPSPEARIREFPHEFSGGMKQRISIAMSLLCGPRVIIADEPTTALDVTIQAQILDLLKRLRETMDTAIIIISHDLGVVANMADNILVMYAGQCVEYGRASELFKRPMHPYTSGLLASIPRLDYEVKTLPVIPGSVLAVGADVPGCRFYPRCPYASVKCASSPPRLIERYGRSVRCWTYEE
jgi:peptide/nickel transport system ATP-binding protein/oligopeptide transport system ATP-binding protein